MGLVLIEDKGQKEKHHVMKNNYWKWLGVDVQRYPLPVGDYVLADEKVMDVIKRKTERNMAIKKMDFLGSYSVCVDTKKDIQELVGDICGKQHERFRDECILAQNNGIQLYIVVENGFEPVDFKKDIYNETITKLSDLHKWINPRLFKFGKGGVRKYPNATRGVTLMKACMTMEKKYGVKFIFCSEENAGAIVLKLLGVKEL